MGMIDPARPEVKAAIKIAQGAGLKSVMVTGDYKDTAEAIAKEIGLLSPGGRVLTGQELDKMSEGELRPSSTRWMPAAGFLRSTRPRSSMPSRPEVMWWR
jgi:magnesium-transporting ATPase (P-type)